MSAKKSTSNSLTGAPATKTQIVELSHTAPGILERPEEIDAIIQAVTAQFEARTPYKRILVTDISEATRRIRQLQGMYDKLLRAARRERVRTILSARRHAPDAPSMHPFGTTEALAEAYIYGGPATRDQAAGVVAKFKVELDWLDAITWSADADELASLDQAVERP